MGPWCVLSSLNASFTNIIKGDQVPSVTSSLAITHDWWFGSTMRLLRSRAPPMIVTYRRQPLRFPTQDLLQVLWRARKISISITRSTKLRSLRIGTMVLWAILTLHTSALAQNRTYYLYAWCCFPSPMLIDQPFLSYKYLREIVISSAICLRPRPST